MAETVVADVMMAVATTAVSGSSYYFSSVAAVPVLVSAATVAVVTTVAAQAIAAMAVLYHGLTAVATHAETAVAANFFGNGPGGIFGCPSCHENNPTLTETLKLFLPYFPLHIQNLITMYLKFLEFMHTFEMIRNMMNHMDEYQALFKMFEGMGDTTSPFPANTGFSMPDLSAVQKMMEGSDLEDEFTYVEEPSGTGWYGS